MLQFFALLNFAVAAVMMVYVWKVWAYLKDLRAADETEMLVPRGASRDMPKEVDQAAIIAAALQQWNTAEMEPVKEDSAVAGVSDGDLQRIIKLVQQAQGVR